MKRSYSRLNSTRLENKPLISNLNRHFLVKIVLKESSLPPFNESAFTSKYVMDGFASVGYYVQEACGSREGTVFAWREKMAYT